MRPPAEETTRRWRKLESDLATKLEGWLTVGSGNKSDKGDAKSYLFLAECKYRWAWNEALTWYVPFDIQWLEAICRHSQARNKVPLLALEWGDSTRTCMIPTLSYIDYIDESVSILRVENRRVLPLGVELCDQTVQFDFTNIEVSQKSWIMFPWEDLSWLRLGELELRKEIGSKYTGTKKIGKSPSRWPKRTFR